VGIYLYGSEFVSYFLPILNVSVSDALYRSSFLSSLSRSRVIVLKTKFINRNENNICDSNEFENNINNKIQTKLKKIKQNSRNEIENKIKNDNENKIQTDLKMKLRTKFKQN
jgi:hypothetical protein